MEAHRDVPDLLAVAHALRIVWIPPTILAVAAQVLPVTRHVQHIVKIHLTIQVVVVQVLRAVLHVLRTVRILLITLAEDVLGHRAVLSVQMVAKLVARQHVKKAVPRTAQVNVVTDARAIAQQHVKIAATMAARGVAMLRAVVSAKATVKVHASACAPTELKVVAEEVATAPAALSVQEHAVITVIPAASMSVKHNDTQIKEISRPWQDGRMKNITFIVTKDCQLACKYCYLVGKNEKERMPWDIAKAAIDYILDREQEFTEESVIWDFIGGEPFLEIDLIDKICDYIKLELYRRQHHWFESYRFSFSTNGINYDSPKVQKFIKKNINHLSIGITIDGTKRKHDLNRIWKGNGVEKGSYEDVVKNIPLWLKQFPGAATKVTISSADIPYIKESVLHLYSLGIHEVNINCVFENVWNEGDDLLFEKQLIELADEIIEKELYYEFACSFFADYIGKPMDYHLDNQNWCGAGMMLAVDAAGNFYPCTRFAAYSLRSKKPIIIGNVRDGINDNLLRPFLSLDRFSQSSQKCLECDVASGCAWCQGENYDAADSPTIFQRSTAICKMHKAHVRANNYYWNKLFRVLELEGRREEFERNKLQQTIKPC